jgi:hypothetical protein
VALGVISLASPDAEASSVLDDARWAFYSARYESAAALAHDPCMADTSSLAACELRTAALLLQIRRAMGDFGAALTTAQLLLIDFPDNQDLIRFVDQRRQASVAMGVAASLMKDDAQ